MVVNPEIKEVYNEIQRQLFYMIPEKWTNVYLYSSILKKSNNIDMGELYFYYIPKSILKKNPVNVYEIPFKFNIDEREYLKLVDRLYNEIKRLYKLTLMQGMEKWSSINILLGDLKFEVDYNYENGNNFKYNSYENHIIFRYIYLKYPLSSFRKQEREIILRYMYERKSKKQNKVIYTEPLYEMPYKTIKANSKKSNIMYIKEDELLALNEPKDIKSQILKSSI